MRGLCVLGAVIVMGASSVAWAQTLDGQMQRMQQGQPAASPATAREWPAASNDAMRPGSAIDSEGEGAIPALPSVVQQSGNVLFINGGISDEDVAALKARADQFNLHLLISATDGAYVSNISLRVMDAQGNAVLSLDDAGPYVYARLAPGVYTLEAASPTEGSKKVKIRVPATGSAKQHFAFSE